jgi:toxin ParE1/3/4
MSSLFWTPEAVGDRERIFAFIATENPRAAIAMDAMFSEKAARLQQHPQAGRPGRVRGTRELVVHPHYVLIYQHAGDDLRILRLLHAARQWP